MTNAHEMRSRIVMIVDDDDDDCDLISDAWQEVRPGVDTRCASNGEHLINQLERMASNQGALPDIVLLDLNMPHVDGWTALAAMKEDAAFRSIPVIVFTTSAVKEHVDDAYEMQAAGFITKPSSYRELVDIVATIDRYWFSTVSRPDDHKDRGNLHAPPRGSTV